MSVGGALSRIVLAALTAAALPAAAGAAEAGAGTIGVELNRLMQAESKCRLSLVFTNRLPVAIEALELETVLFDKDGRAGRFLKLKSQPLTPGKIRVNQYDLDDTSCADIGSVLVNDVIACEGDGLDPAACLSKLAVSSREPAPLVLTITDTPAAAPASEAGKP